MPKILNLVGQKFGRLLVYEKGISVRGIQFWQCECECGTRTKVRTGSLRSGRTQTCGCGIRDAVVRRNSKHGRSKSGVEYETWKRIRQRCYNPNNQDYIYYGARGICVCSRWDDFQNFIADMGPRPSPRHSIDRIDVNGNYEPQNCRWATSEIQRRNRRDYIATHGTTA